MLAPIAIFAFNRPNHLQKTLKSLLESPLAMSSKCFIFIDGPRTEEDKALVEQVHRIAMNTDGFENKTIIKQTNNLGLAQSIIQGVSQITEEYGQVIVLEDDILVAPCFLEYMNLALEIYRDDSAVGSIQAYCPELNTDLGETFFLLGADCWGWATWRDRWQCFEPDGKKLLAELKNKNLMSTFDFDSHAGLQAMLEDQIAGKNNSWAVRWVASSVLNGLHALYPGNSLVQNIGFDGSGAHCDTTNAYDVVPATKLPDLEKIAVEDNPAARAAMTRFYKQLKPKLTTRIVNRARKWFLPEAKRG